MPTTFAAQINGDDIYAKRAECDAAGNDLSTTYATKSELPTIVGLTAGANVTITEGNNAITIAATDTTYSAGTGLSLSGTTFSNADPLPAHTSTESGKVLGVDSNGELGWVNQSGGGGTTYTAGDGIDITSDVISADVDGTTIGIDSSTKKIKLLSTIPSVDQTYSAASTNAQSGTSVAGAIATKEDAFDVGTGLEMDTSGATPTLQVEAPVDIVAGPGIAIDNPDGNTMRITNTGFPISATDAVLCGTFRGDPMYTKTYTFTGTIGTSETTISMTIDEKKGTNNVNRIWVDPSTSFILYGSAGNNFLPLSWRLGSSRQGSVAVLGASTGSLSCRCIDTSSTPITLNITIRYTVSNS